jgi:hypothetical protein
MGEKYSVTLNGAYLMIIAGILLMQSQQNVTAQQPFATPSPVSSPSIPSDLNPIPTGQPEFQGVPPAVAPLQAPGENTAPKPVFSEPVTPSPLSGIATPPPPSMKAPPVTTQPTNDISLNDLKASSDFRFRLGATIRATYDSNVFIQPQNEVGDLYAVIAPSFAIGSGSFDAPLTARQHTFLQPQGFNNADLLKPQTAPFLYLSYTPSYTAFLDRTDQNSFDHDAIFETQITLQRLTLGAFARFQTFRLPNVDIGNRVSEQLTSVQAYAFYAWSPKTQLNTQIFFQHQDFKTQIGSYDLWNEDWLDYQYSTKTSFGPGLAVGTLIPTAGPEQLYGRFQARGTWSPTGKLSFAAKGGVEIRSVNGEGEKVYPIFGVEGRYTLTERTSASVSVYQQIGASASIQAVDAVNRGVTVGLQQKILDRFRIDSSIGYSNTTYDSFAHLSNGSSRNDKVFFVGSNLTTKIDRWIDFVTGVQYYNDSSSAQNRGYDEILGTCEVHLKY